MKATHKRYFVKLGLGMRGIALGRQASRSFLRCSAKTKQACLGPALLVRRTLQVRIPRPKNKADQRVKPIARPWLGMRDSNPRSWDQNPLPYRLANPQCEVDYSALGAEMLPG